MATPAPSPQMRQLMPPGFIRILSQRTGCKYPGTISSAVSLENAAWDGWPEVLKLAQETNPEGFAKWEAAHAAQTA